MSTDLLLAAAGNAAGEGTYVEDVFSTYLYTGNGGTQVIENGIALGDANSGGSVEFDGTGDYLAIPDSTDFDFGTGDFTWEAWIQTNVNVNYQNIVGQWDGGNAWGIHTNSSGTITYFTATSTVYNGSITVTDNAWHHIAITRQSGTIRLFVDGVSDGSSSDTNTIGDTGNVRIGSLRTGYERYFAGYISNVRLVKGTAIYTSAFTPSTTALTAVSGTSLLTCQGDTPLVDNSSNAHTITVNGDASAKAFGPFTSDTEGKGGLVWIKDRDATYGHYWFDTERGAGKNILSNLTGAEVTDTNKLSSFNSNGFSLGTNVAVSTSGDNYASWTFAKQEKFFDVVTYTGNSVAGRTVSHNLGSVPGMIIVKRLNATVDWCIYHRGVDATSPEDYFMKFNTDAREDNLGIWNDTAPTSTEFTVGSSSAVNNSSGTYVAYLFAHNDGDGEFGEGADQDIIKCGSVSTDASGDADIDLGFEPQWVLFKPTSTTLSWYLWDNMRGMVVGGADAPLFPDTSGAEISADNIQPNATGFHIDALSNQDWIYIAIRRGPMKTPESSTEVFAPEYGLNASAGGQAWSAGFPVDMYIRKNPAGSTNYIASRTTGNGPYMATDSTAAETSLAYSEKLDNMDGVFTTNAYNYTPWISWMFRRAPKFFDVVTWKGDGTSFNRRISHNLEQEPRLILLKARNSASYNWTLYYHFSSATVPHERFWFVNTGSPVYGTGTGSYQYLWGNAPASTTDFGVGSYNNTANIDYVAYLFGASDISTTGLYLGNGTSTTRYPGTTTDDVRFLLIKEYSATSPWYIFDVERGIAAGNDPYLKLNTTDAEVTTTDVIDPVPGGFTVNQTATENLNANGSYYLYYAIK